MDAANNTPVDRHSDAPTGNSAPPSSADQCPVNHATGESAQGADTPSRSVTPAAELSGPRILPLVQSIMYWKRPVAFMERCRNRYGSRFMVRVTVPPRPLYVITEPEDVKQMFLAPADVLHTGRSSARIEKFTGQSGLAWLDEDEHKARRKQLMPSFHGKALHRIEASITEMAKDAIATWPREANVALHPYIYRFTLDVIREVIFGPATPKRWGELQGILVDMMRFNDRMASVLMIHRMSPATVRRLRAIRPLGLHNFLNLRDRADALISEAVEERRNSGTVGGDDMLSVLLGIRHDDGSPLSISELRDEMMTIFLAGTETTSGALAWAFLYLSREHAIRERLVAEIDAGESDSFLTATVHEVLRVRPSIPQVIAREVMKPIEIGGVRFEPGMLIWASAYLMHHNPSVYPDPYEFRAERFLGVKPGMYTWIPFGGGRIRCLGSEIGIIEMKVVLREVLTQCELQQVTSRLERTRSRGVVTMPEKDGRLKLRPRLGAKLPVGH